MIEEKKIPFNCVNEHAERKSRAFQVSKAMLEGYTNRRILIQYLTEKYDWGVSERTLDNYIRDAKEILHNISENELEFEKNLALNRLEALYTMNYKINDYRECRNIVESRAKLLGINAPEKIQHSGDILPPHIVFKDFSSNE